MRVHTGFIILNTQEYSVQTMLKFYYLQRLLFIKIPTDITPSKRCYGYKSLKD